MAKKVILFLLMVFCFTTLFGLYSDDFILSSYTYLRGSYEEIFFQYLSEANYNCLNASIIDESVQSLYQKSDDHNLDIILHDHIWQPENEVVGVYNLTCSNNYYYEAEYSEIGETNLNNDLDDKFYYRIHREYNMGESWPYEDASNDNVWQCLEGIHNTGIVCDTLFWKWQRSGVDKHVEKEILLPKKNSLFIMDTLYFEFQLKIDDLSHPDDTPICVLNFYIATKEGDHYIQNNLTLNSCNPSVYDNQLTVGEYNAVQSPDPYKTFSFYALVDRIDEDLIFDSYHPSLKNINFKVYWHGNGNLYLDRFRIYDDIYRKLEEGVYDNMLTTRVNSLKEDAHNLKFLYSKDEPAQPQFDSYRLVENSLSDSLITAVNRKGYWCGTTSGIYNYFHHKLFEYLSEPEQIMLDVYPISGNKKWNCHPNSILMYHVQDRIQLMVESYKKVKQLCEDENLDFLCIPQTYGRYYPDLNPNNQPTYWSNMRPPSNMQKCLQYLPLCYGADGIIDYKFISKYNYTRGNEEFPEPTDDDTDVVEPEPIEFHRLALVDREGETNEGNPILTPQYFAIQEANEEILNIGSIIKNLTWICSGTIGIDDDEFPIEDEFVPDLQYLDRIEVIGNDPYAGYIECGEFINEDIEHYFMLVNRRTNYSLPDYTNPDNGYTEFIPKNTDLAFNVAPPQVLVFHFTDPIMNNYVLIDQYYGDIYDIYPYNNNYISDPIIINPGDGMLLKLCQLPIPEEITGFIFVSGCYIPYNVTILNGGTLYVGDNVEFGPFSIITVESGGSLIMQGNIKFGSNSKIVTNGYLNISPATSVPTCLTSKIDKWQGIECYEGGQVFIQNEACIEKAEIGILCDGGEVYVDDSIIHLCKTGIKLHNSTLEFISSNILIPNVEDAVGIFIGNITTENNVIITGTEEDISIIECISRKRTGIYLKSYVDEEDKIFNCNFTEFKNLEIGILHNSFCRTDHEITSCRFENCDTGIQLFGTGSINKIEDCDFIDNGCGVNQNTVSTNVIECDFTNNEIGIDYSNTHQQRGPGQPSIGDAHSSLFNGEDDNIKGIRCSDSSPRVSNCIFETYYGILSVDNAKVNASWGAKNVFIDSNIHLFFFPEESNLSSEISLRNGHNDFYDQGWDFGFSSAYAGSLITINANGNWWEDFEVDSLCFGGSIPPLIIADEMDPEPNVPFISPPDNRFETASQEESQGNYEIALESFKTILDDKLETEKRFWSICIDKVYNLSLVLEEDINALLNYYEILYLSTPEYLTEEERTSLQAILKNYQKKCHVEKGEYQEAADIVVERINNPISTLDSLFAVMQLETIYMLSYLDSTGRGNFVVTSYDKLAPKTLREHNQKHKDHWNEIYSLLGIGENPEDEGNQNIPSVPVLSGNYPNPFNPETKIAFSIPEDSKVDLSIYNIRGQKVRTLVKTKLEKGFHEIIWNSKDNNRKSVATGVYFYKFDVNSKTRGVKKMLLLK